MSFDFSEDGPKQTVDNDSASDDETGDRAGSPSDSAEGETSMAN